MSLVSLALRLATIRALQGRTWAENRVYDSKIDTIDAIALNETAPVIIVTTDDNETDVVGRDVFSGDHKLELVIEVAVWTKVAREKQGEVLIVPATDAGLEISLNMICYQIMRALAGDGGEWGDLWRTIVTRISKVTSRRGADETNGIRYAARQLILTVDHIAEPLPGQMPAEGDAWHRILSMLKEDAEFEAVGKIIEGEIESVDLMPWQQVRASLGLADDEATWIGNRPVKIVEEAVLTEIEMPNGFKINSETAADANGPEEQS